MTAPHSHLLEGSPRLHYLEWNPHAPRTIILLHGNTANAWWWEPLARVIAAEYRLLALDQRGPGDSPWARSISPAAQITSGGDLSRSRNRQGALSADTQRGRSRRRCPS